MKHRQSPSILVSFATWLGTALFAVGAQAQPAGHSAAEPPTAVPNPVPATGEASTSSAAVTTSVHAATSPTPQVSAAEQLTIPAQVIPAGFDATAPQTEDYATSTQALDATLNGLLNIPETPAAFALGISTETVAQPGTLRDAISQVTTHISPGGTIQPGVAIEVAPFRTMFENIDIDSWTKRGSRLRHVPDSFRISFATASDPNPPAGATSDTLVGIGARLSLWDDRDYRNNPKFIQSTRAALTACFPKGPTTPGLGGANYSSVPVDSACGDHLTAVMQHLEETLKHGSRLELASVVTVAEGPSRTQVDWRSTKAWLAYDYAMGVASVGAAAMSDWQDDPRGFKVNSQSIGMRLGFDSPKVKWSASAWYGRVGVVPDQKNDTLKFGGNATLKLGTLGFLSGGIQGLRDLDAKTSQAMVLVSVTTSNDENAFARAFAAPAHQ